MFLTPDGEPFFGGTYFPKHGRYGLPGFLELLPRVAAAYREQGDAIAEQSARLAEALASLEPPDAAPRPRCPRDAPAQALAGLKRSFDPVHGGFGAAPKFPHPAELEFCLRAHARDRRRATRCTIVAHDARRDGRRRHPRPAGRRLLPLQRRRASGRSRTSRRCSTTTGRCSGSTPTSRASPATPRMRDVARGIVGWLAREMRAPDGAFYSSLDADSEGEEGKFYVWTRDEARALLPADEYAVAAPHFGLDGPPNFEGHAWNLRVVVPLDEVAAAPRHLAAGCADAARRGARRRCSPRAAARVRPGLDDKILTSWNALAIAGLARAARALDEPRWADLAVAARRRAARAPPGATAGCCATRSGERADLNALPRRLRVPARRAARAACRRASGAQDYRLGARARRRAARRVRGPRARRLLLHEPRSRGADPPPEARARQRDAVGQRRGGAGADRARPPRRGAALRRGGERAVRLFAGGARRSRRAAIRRCSCALEDALVAADVGAARRRPGRVRGVAARAGSALSADERGCSISRAAATCRRRCVKGPAPADGRCGVGVPRDAVPAAGPRRCRELDGGCCPRGLTPASHGAVNGSRAGVGRTSQPGGRWRGATASGTIARRSDRPSSRRIHEIAARRSRRRGAARRRRRPAPRPARRCSRRTAAPPATRSTRRSSARRTTTSPPSTRATPAPPRSSPARSRRAAPASGARSRCRRTRRSPTPTSRRWSPTSSR